MSSRSKNADSAHALASMRGYAATRPEIDKLLDRIVGPTLAAGNLSILDAACGIGHLAPWLLRLGPNLTYLGVDQADFLIAEAQRLFANKHARFETGDVTALPDRYPDGFDVVVSWKTMSWLAHYESMLSALMRLTRRALFVSSLFYEGDIDCEIRVTEHQNVRKGRTSQSFYNVYSLPRFAARARELGAIKVEPHNFDIPIDLPRPDPDAMGTYTRRLREGGRLQFSGPLAMPWKILEITVG